MIELYAKVVSLDGGYDCDKEYIKRYHKIGDIFKVYDIEMGQSYTSIFEDDARSYGSVYFKFYSDKECTIEKDIYDDPRLNPYL